MAEENTLFGVTNEDYREVAFETLIGVLAITVVSVFLNITGIVDDLVVTSLLSFIGYSLYFEVVEKLTESTGLSKIFSLKKSFLAILFFAPLAITVARKAFFSQFFAEVSVLQGLSTLFLAHVKAFGIFTIIVILHEFLTEQTGFEQLKFHWQLIIAVAVLGAFPVFLVSVFQTGFAEVVSYIQG